MVPPILKKRSTTTELQHLSAPSKRRRRNLKHERSNLMQLSLLIMLGVYFLMCAIHANSASASEMPSTSTSTKSAHEIDPNFRNFNLIGNKVIPDVSYILENNDDKFASLKQFLNAGWTVLQMDGYKIRKDIPFTIIVPRLDIRSVERTRLKDVLLEHIIPGRALDTFSHDDIYGNSNGHSISFKTIDQVDESQWTLNGLKVLKIVQINDKVSAIYIDGYLGDRRTAAKRNIQESNRYNEPQRLEMKNATTKTETAASKPELPKISGPLMNFLSGMKSGTKVFQHFLAKSNLTAIMDDGPYTILIPSDNAFQRWHPIDWGFYPFSVQEFTETVLRNHFLVTNNPLRMADIKNNNELKQRTLGGETVVFRNYPSPNVNNVSILNEYTLSNGNQVLLITEVLFVSEAVVSRLHQMHKDKETPPLLAFPWFGAQFLSHSFLALERDPRFTQITRYLNNAEIAPYISGANYTFFVPVDDAFEKLGFDLIPDDILASEKGVKMLLNHFVKGRLYDRDLKHDEVLDTIGGEAIRIQRKNPGNNVTVNNARIIETEIFVYNLGTMFYIDDIMYSDILKDFATNPINPSIGTAGITEGTPFEASGNGVSLNGAKSPVAVTPSDVEVVRNEFTEQNDSDQPASNSEDEDDDEIIPPKALPVLVRMDQPRK